MATPHVPVLVDFVSSVPPALTGALVHLGPYIAQARHAAQVISWQSPLVSDSWLALAAWWAICLLAEPVARYFLPAAIVAGTFFVRLRSSNARQTAPVTETTLQNTISDLLTLQTLAPSSPSIPILPGKVIANVVLRIYIPYLLVAYFVPLRVLLALSGSVMLCWRSPWFIFVRTTLWRSAWVRWGVYKSWAVLSQTPVLPTPSIQSLNISSTTTEDGEDSVVFLFTVYENQRWWMGIDWTAALLPSERPSWSTEALQPVSPPGPSFVLPEPSEAILPSPDSKGKRIRRRAVWRWAEPDWTVLVRTSEEAQAARIARPLPEGMDDANPTLLTKAAARMREASEKEAQSQKDREAENKGGSAAVHEDNEDDDGEEKDVVLTDPDGWVYGDNKWEAQSNKGGMGKYTRYRRWTRIAVVTETVEVLDEEGETGIKYEQVEESPAPQPQRTPSLESEQRNSSPLRQRLKNALNRGSVG